MRSLMIVILLVCLSITGCGGGGGGGGGGGNTAPVANAGPDQNVTMTIGTTGRLVTLDGSASSDVDGDELTYAWTFVSRPDGSSATLSNATVVNPTFTADLEGSYVLSLVVNDGTVSSAADTVTITAATANSAPVANAGPDQNVTTGTLVTLDGSGSSDADSDELTYSWVLVSQPAGGTASLSSSTVVNPTFTANVDGAYVFSLVVNDGELNSTADSVIITAATENSAPVANAGPDQYVIDDSLITLDGSASSDADGDELTYAWSFVSRPDGSSAALSNATAVDPTFTADVEGTYVLRLVVNDGTVDSAADTVLINRVADYSSLFLKNPQSLIFRNGDIILSGSVFALEIQNTATIAFVCTRAELRNGPDIVVFTENPADLGGDQIIPNEVVGLSHTLAADVTDGGFEFRYYLRHPGTNEEFIVSHQY